MEDKGTESRGHHVTCPSLLGIQGQVFGCWCSLLSINPHAPQYRHRTWDPWFGTFSGHTDVPHSHPWSHFAIPLLGSWPAPFASLQISFAAFRAGLQGRGKPCGVTVNGKALGGPHFLADWLICLQEESCPTIFPIKWRWEFLSPRL